MTPHLPNLPRRRARYALALITAAALGAAGQAQTATPSAASAAAAPASGAGNGIANERAFPAIASGRWSGPRLPDGQPDIGGHWSNTIGNHGNFTDPQGGLLSDPNRLKKLTTTRAERAPSRVSDPPDGEVPLQPWARARQQEFVANFSNPTKPQFVEPLARCAPGGVPKSLYWHGYDIRQYPGYVLFIFDSGSRLIHLDGKPHLPERIKLWNADSRGRWEGNTLVVDVANSNGKALFGRSGEFASENLRVTERYVFSPDGARFNYIATFTDPSVFTQPWTATIPARKWTEKDTPNGWHYDVFINKTGAQPVVERHERICVENNGGFGNVAATAATVAPAAAPR